MDYFQSMNDLIKALLGGHKVEEAHSLCIYIMEYAELALGKRHYWYNGYKVALGRILSKRGMALESIKNFYSALLGAHHRGLRSGICQNLGSALMNGRNFEEAIYMYRKSLSIDVQQQGWSNFAKLKKICGKLGYCYEVLSQLQDTLFLYENLLGKLKDALGDENPFIKEVKYWVSEVQERMVESSASSEDDGSNNTYSSREVQMGGVDDDLGYG
ncbi:uncharacterized protein EAF01_011808 [Botrytis porri]|nr:uncharacterized protein EAF01_011808 [Botrytis porri]KAF7882028.1 hypothetical protein EAF01_011808 [Botrytis porri]